MLVGEQPGRVQHPGVGARAGDVVRREPPVEVGALRQCGERLVGTAGEAPAPEAHSAPAAALGAPSLPSVALVRVGSVIAGSPRGIAWVGMGPVSAAVRRWVQSRVPARDWSRSATAAACSALPVDEQDRVVAGDGADHLGVAGLVDGRGEVVGGARRGAQHDEVDGGRG